MLKIAVIGHGFLGRWHAEKVFNNKSVIFSSIVESNIDAHSEISKKFPNTKVLKNVNELDLNNLDGVIISTPTSSHFELTKFFLEKKVNVFCEKPLCATLDEAEKLKQYLIDDLVLQVGHSERYHPIWTQFKEDLKETTGPYIIKADRLAPFKGRATDVDVVQDLMIHDLDLIRFLFSKLEIKSINSIGFKQRTEHADYAQTQMSFSEGSQAIISVGRNYIKEKRSLEVTCKQGTFFVDLFTAEYLKALGSEENSEKYVQTIKYQKADHLDLEQKAFFATILKEQENLVDYEQGIEAVRLVESVREQI